MCVLITLYTVPIPIYVYTYSIFIAIPCVAYDLSESGIVEGIPSASTFTGTIAYMSPERLRGQPYNFKVSYV